MNIEGVVTLYLFVTRTNTHTYTHAYMHTYKYAHTQIELSSSVLNVFMGVMHKNYLQKIANKEWV